MGEVVRDTLKENSRMILRCRIFGEYFEFLKKTRRI
jgi:hypothetical protein